MNVGIENEVAQFLRKYKSDFRCSALNFVTIILR
jgi:hypothetical protein